MNKEPLDIERVLPIGEMLRSYLNQPVISRTEMSDLLRRRGVFLPSTEKAVSIPFFSKTLIDSDEFESLRECYRSKEDTMKRITRTIEWGSDKELIDSIPDELFRNVADDIPFANFELNGVPQFVPIGDDKNHVKAEYRILRTDHSQSWVESKREFKGELELEVVEQDGQVKMLMTYTADETKLLAEKATAGLVNHWKEQEFVRSNTEADRILFSSFTNRSRIAFLLDLTVNCNMVGLIFKDLSDIGIIPDESMESYPANLKWVQNRIEDLRYKGRTLQEVEHLKDDACHDFIMVYQVDARFTFEIHGATGEFTASFSFPKFRTSQSRDSELEVKVTSLRIESGSREARQNKIKRDILDLLNHQMVKRFQSERLPV